MSIRTRLLAIVKAAASVRKPAAIPAPVVVPVFSVVHDDLPSQFARLRDQGYSMLNAGKMLSISYRQARKIEAANKAAREIPAVW